MKCKLIKNSMFAGLVLFTFACSQTSEMGEEASMAAATGSQSEFGELYNKVMAEYKKLDSEGGAWRDTEETLEKAQAAAKKNDFATAMKLVKQASDETQIAMKQFEEQKSARPALF